MVLLVAFAVGLADARAANAPAPEKTQAAYPFNFDTLLADAKRLAATAYAPQRSKLPAVLDKLSPEQCSLNL